jgi:hypothetical protein
VPVLLFRRQVEVHAVTLYSALWCAGSRDSRCASGAFPGFPVRLYHQFYRSGCGAGVAATND